MQNYSDDGGHWYEDDHGFKTAITRIECSLACDLGQARDYGTVCAMKKIREPIPAERVSADLIRRLDEPRFEIPGIARFPLGTGYDAIVDSLRNLTAVPGFERCYPLVDVTGNRAFSKLAADRGLRIEPIQIVAGGPNYQKWAGGYHNISKAALVNGLEAIYRRRKLSGPDTPGYKALIEELRQFQVSYTAAGNPSWGAVGSAHDDLVVAAALSYFGVSEDKGNHWSIVTHSLWA